MVRATFMVLKYERAERWSLAAALSRKSFAGFERLAFEEISALVRSEFVLAGPSRAC